MPEKQRCTWAATADPMMQEYHDTEWGVPIHDSRLLWESLMLEGFQAGLSWQIILRKRAAFRKAFCGFDPAKVALFDAEDIQRLMVDPGIVRSRAKIAAVIHNAQRFLAMAARGESFSSYSWSFTSGAPLATTGQSAESEAALSTTISKDLKQRGFKFIGPTVVHAWLQAVGIINGHSPTCFRHSQLKSSSTTNSAPPPHLLCPPKKYSPKN